MELALLAGSTLSFLAWVYLLLGHGGYWKGDQRLQTHPLTCPLLPNWPQVTIIVPARNEADVIEQSIQSLLNQDYPGTFHLVLVDDHSNDGTGDLAKQIASQHLKGHLLTVIQSGERPRGWMGKMWALHTGLQYAQEHWPTAQFHYFTDADILHSPGNLRGLVVKGVSEHLDLVSLMVRLHCQNTWEKFLIPTFVYFFQKVYPFPQINDPESSIGGAAGGCMLVRTKALKNIGGIAAIRGEVIDDCALGAKIKQQGNIWLGLTDTEQSIRPYHHLSDIWEMVRRTAFTQLRYSPWLLGQTFLGLILLYLLPPLITLTLPFHGSFWAGLLSVLAWIIMGITFHPTLRSYALSPSMGLLLPLAGMYYLGMTVDSAHRHWRGVGVQWKGRTSLGYPE